MKVTLTDESRVVYEKRTTQIKVEIDGVEYTIRNSEDDNGCDYHVYSESLNDGVFMNPYDLEDGELKDVIIKLAETCYDDFLFSDSRVGQAVDLEELEDY
jgi:hypothetical protein